MSTLHLLRNLILVLTLAMAADPVSAADSGKTPKRANKPTAEHTAKPARKKVAAFVDPTLPLAEFVERARTERDH